MKELEYLRRLRHSYSVLGLSYSRVISVLGLMMVSALLEMAGLSMLYALVRVLGNGTQELNRPSLGLPALAGRDPRTQMVILFGVVAILYIAKNVALYYTFRHNINFAMYYYRHLIRGLYRAYAHRSLLDFRKESAGSLTNIVCVQSGRLVDGTVRPLLVIVTEGTVLGAICLLTFLVNPLLILSLITFCGAAAAVYYWIFRGTALNWGRRRMDASTLLHELIHITAAGFGEIKVFGKEEYLAGRVFDAASDETEMFRNLEMYQQGPRFVIESAFVVMFAAAFAVVLLRGGELPVVLATFSVVAASSFRILPSLNRIVGSYSTFSFHLAPALSLLRDIETHHLLAPEGAGEPISADVLGGPVKALELADVSFQYPTSGQAILRHVNLTVRNGQRVGIVGPTGSGKSTLVEILAGLYAPSAGVVRVDGTPMSSRVRAWQRQLGYVPQVSFVMPGTVRENVAFESDDKATDDDVWVALRAVGLSRLVESMPSGLDTQIGEKGQGLSGGQKQLLCLARAMCRRPALLLLDEPTASLDPESEAAVIDAINRLSSETTIVMVSHKAENFRHFDVVYDCEQGELRETAHHTVARQPTR